ncbi:hypothetical protein EHQ99_18440 [Leptospira bouyouniensis]|nr:hypothetical protein EHQ99_18440 [Leptospira bouyouniensis]
MMLLLFLGEVTFHTFNNQTTEEIRYKKIHCLKGFTQIRLCPDINQTFTRADGKPWDIKTNRFGERIVSEEQNHTNPAKIWLIGDSMSMGYGLPSRETISYILENEFDLKIRVIAVDAIGTNGILSLFEDTYRTTIEENLPTHVYWIWNPSDFIDDEREKKGIQQMFYPFHFYLSRNSFLYQKILPATKNNVYTNSISFLYPSSHITYTNLKHLLERVSQNKEQWRILFSWGMAPSGKPDTSDPNYDVANQFFIKAGFQTIDLRKKTEMMFANQKKIYIPNDGHPDQELAKIFAEAIAVDYKKQK